MYRLSVNTGTVRLIRTHKHLKDIKAQLPFPSVCTQKSDCTFLVRGWEKSFQQMTHVFM